MASCIQPARRRGRWKGQELDQLCAFASHHRGVPKFLAAYNPTRAAPQLVPHWGKLVVSLGLLPNCCGYHASSDRRLSGFARAYTRAAAAHRPAQPSFSNFLSLVPPPAAQQTAPPPPPSPLVSCFEPARSSAHTCPTEPPPPADPPDLLVFRLRSLRASPLRAPLYPQTVS